MSTTRKNRLLALQTLAALVTAAGSLAGSPALTAAGLVGFFAALVAITFTMTGALAKGVTHWNRDRSTFLAVE